MPRPLVRAVQLRRVMGRAQDPFALESRPGTQGNSMEEHAMSQTTKNRLQCGAASTALLGTVTLGMFLTQAAGPCMRAGTMSQKWRISYVS